MDNKEKDIVDKKLIFTTSTRSYERIRELIRKKRGKFLFNKEAEVEVLQYLDETTPTMSHPSDLLNASVEKILDLNFTFPSFERLSLLVLSKRNEYQENVYNAVYRSISAHNFTQLNSLLVVQNENYKSEFTKLKEPPNKPNLSNIHEWIGRYNNLYAFQEVFLFLKNIPFTKIKQFYAEADAFELSEILDTTIKRRYTLLICFLYIKQMQVKDTLIEMFIKRVNKNITNAKNKLEEYKKEHRRNEEKMLQLQEQIFTISIETKNNPSLHHQKLHDLYHRNGGLAYLKQRNQFLNQFHNDNFYPYLLQSHKYYGKALRMIIDKAEIYSVNENLLNDWKKFKRFRNKRTNTIDEDFDLSYLTKKWLKVIIISEDNGQISYHKKHLEIALMYYLSEGLQSFDYFAKGSLEYANTDEYLVSDEELTHELPIIIQDLQLPENGKQMVLHLQKEMKDKIFDFDQHFKKETSSYYRDDKGFHLKKSSKRKRNKEVEKIQLIIKQKLQKHNLLDMMNRVNHHVSFTDNFQFITGTLSKTKDPISNYIYTLFAYGVNIGPTYMSSHCRHKISQRTLSRINKQHISNENLQKAMRTLINFTQSFDIIKKWGNQATAVADGTQIPLLENNMFGERHIRYGGYGGIAYHHISDTYIALFSKFIVCGIWEAIYILDGLIQNQSSLEIKNIHADTQGQNEPVFGLSYLLGIELMPRIRDWKLIEGYYHEMLRIVISIKKGRVIPSLILKKLGIHGRKTKIYKAFRELGRVQRTLFLIDFIRNSALRSNITKSTTKIESFNSFCDWITFGGEQIKSGDPIEQEKRVKYTILLANIIMAHNIIDLTRVINELKEDGLTITDEMIERLNPYMREHIRIYGEFVLNQDNIPNKNIDKKLII
ncbi:hypothetical protein EI427_25700 (plasmid) [Flammeovirga pectinis]|uniref:Tn3 transposase DDE domain-containing protein n=2 Tax=Flammeovirga pectinis TaxID=2494373 RepID=A0A3S9PBY7_9BACT|nr:hypothetical protein EI427_25700 [Flammeovirga pectinis]